MSPAGPVDVSRRARQFLLGDRTNMTNETNRTNWPYVSHPILAITANSLVFSDSIIEKKALTLHRYYS